MARRTSLLFLFFYLLGASITRHAICRPPTLGMDFHHRYSDRVRSWAERMSYDVGSWPERGTVEYYSSLLQHDRDVVRGRGLAESPALTFADGNFTVRINRLGFLHYSIVSLGTPNVTFLVALDTGSDLFWVPCNCKNCASTSGDNYGFNNVIFNYFSSKASSTSKKVPCSSSLCDLQTSCSSPSDVCPYEVKYVSANTSSSGFLLEDVLYLTTDDTQQKPIETRVTFGCGQTQTGAFLRSGGFNGLFGLGRDKISVPSILANSGLTTNSFSMCFGPDGSGRITFGDKGHIDQGITPINNKTEQT